MIHGGDNLKQSFVYQAHFNIHPKWQQKTDLLTAPVSASWIISNITNWKSNDSPIYKPIYTVFLL